MFLLRQQTARSELILMCQPEGRSSERNDLSATCGIVSGQTSSKARIYPLLAAFSMRGAPGLFLSPERMRIRIQPTASSRKPVEPGAACVRDVSGTGAK